MNCPISSYALTIYPYLTLSHALHINSQRLHTFWCIEISLKRLQNGKCLIHLGPNSEPKIQAQKSL
ncbi:hypothetical protein Hanom_Chr04g00378211 [Helianthus anomalus]